MTTTETFEKLISESPNDRNLPRAFADHLYETPGATWSQCLRRAARARRGAIQAREVLVARELLDVANRYTREMITDALIDAHSQHLPLPMIFSVIPGRYHATFKLHDWHGDDGHYVYTRCTIGAGRVLRILKSLRMELQARRAARPPRRR